MHVPQCVHTDLSFSQAALGWNHALLLTGIANSYDNDDVHIYTQNTWTFIEFFFPIFSADAEIFMLGSYGNGILISPEIENQETHKTSKLNDILIHVIFLVESRSIV